MVRASIPDRGKDVFSLLPRQTGSGAHRTS